MDPLDQEAAILGWTASVPEPAALGSARSAWAVASSAAMRFAAEIPGRFRAETLNRQVTSGQQYLTKHLLGGEGGLPELAEQVLDLVRRAVAEGVVDEARVRYGEVLLSAHRAAAATDRG